MIPNTFTNFNIELYCKGLPIYIPVCTVNVCTICTHGPKYLITNMCDYFSYTPDFNRTLNTYRRVCVQSLENIDIHKYSGHLFFSVSEGLLVCLRSQTGMEENEAKREQLVQ